MVCTHTMELRTQHGRCGDMKKAEILKILEKIESMKTISKVKIKNEDFELTVEKVGVIQGPSPTSKVSSATSATSAPGMASPDQVKWARDIVNICVGNDESKILDFLAHTLDVMLTDVPDIDTWDTALTREQAGAIIDALKPMYESKKGGSQ